MKKTYKMVDLDCANCAAKMEDAVRKIEGINSCSVSFMTQKMKVDLDESREEELFSKIVKVCKKVDSDCDIVKI